MGFILAPIASLGASVGGALGMAGPMTFGSSLAMGVGTIGVAGYLGKTLLSGAKSPSMPSTDLNAQVGPAPTYAQAGATAAEETKELQRRKAAGTTLTSPQGLLSTNQSVGKTLLGS